MTAAEMKMINKHIREKKQRDKIKIPTIKQPKIYGKKIIQYKQIIKPEERAKFTFRRPDFLGRVEI
jgi:hypothetical protein